MARCFAWIVAAGLLVGCVSEQAYKKAVTSWEGQNINALVKVWGYPDKTEKAPSGNRLYVYTVSETSMSPTYETETTSKVKHKGDGTTNVTTTPGTKYGGEKHKYTCDTWFEVDDKDIIITAVSRGDYCVATKDEAKALKHKDDFFSM